MHLTFERVAQPKHPVDQIREAVLNQRASGVRVRIGSLGVHCTSQEPPCWERDPQASGVSPLGAVLLENPEAPATDPHEALAAVFGDAPLSFVDGLADGIDKAEPDRARVGRIGAMAYVGGWEVGYRYREEFLRGGFSS